LKGTALERYHWRDENVPGGAGARLHIYDRNRRLEPIAVCTDPDVAERIVTLLNEYEAARKEPS
jgi:hypothetical protein